MDGGKKNLQSALNGRCGAVVGAATRHPAAKVGTSPSELKCCLGKFKFLTNPESFLLWAESSARSAMVMRSRRLTLHKQHNIVQGGGQRKSASKSRIHRPSTGAEAGMLYVHVMPQPARWARCAVPPSTRAAPSSVARDAAVCGAYPRDQSSRSKRC